MPTSSAYASPVYTTTTSKRDPADFELDDEWKRQLKENTEESFKSMIREAKDNQQAQLLQGKHLTRRLVITDFPSRFRGRRRKG